MLLNMELFPPYLSLEGEGSVATRSNTGNSLLLVQEKRLLRMFNIYVYLVYDLYLFE